MKTVKLSPARILFTHIRNTHNLHSFQGYNPCWESMKLAICSHLEFHKDDLSNMVTNTSYLTNTLNDYLSHHNQGRGQNEYSLSCSVNNVSACHAFEFYFGIKPFKIKARRCVLGEYYYLSRTVRIRASGYQLEKKKILCVQEELIGGLWTKTKHPSFTNSEWREFVKTNNYFEN
ncbi:hypothetical protein DXA95_04695 [Odoribacter sp. OF09-27XD]|jgi:hypothetical protein|nr:hypothetical protein DXA95_04695 [Odoribacter sp. OF09-27XD]